MVAYYYLFVKHPLITAYLKEKRNVRLHPERLDDGRESMKDPSDKNIPEKPFREAAVNEHFHRLLYSILGMCQISIALPKF